MPMMPTVRREATREQTASLELVVGLIAIPIAIFGAATSTLLAQALGRACSLKAIFGLPCPTCGSTRAVQQLLQGNISGAFMMQPLVVTSAALACLFSIYSFGVIVLKWPRLFILRHLQLSNRIYFWAAVVIAFNWIYLIMSGY